MKAEVECIPCMLTQAINTTRMVTEDEETLLKVVREVIECIKESDLDLPPATFSTPAYRIAERITGVGDPYKEIKKRYNDLALKMSTEAKRIIDKSKDRLHTAFKLSVVGNIIDLGIGHPFNLEETTAEILKSGFAIDHFQKFKEDLQSSKKILFVGDNAGEIVFDKLLVEELRDYYLTYAVRGGAIINDATLEDALYVGMDKVAKKIITTGTNAVGAPLDEVSKEFRQAFEEADIVIAKGHANYETLVDGPRKCFFILKAKCSVVGKHLGGKKGDMVLVKK